MSVFLAPTFGVGYQAFSANGAVLNGGKLFTYQAGTSTLQATYTSSSGLIANANPIILNSDGRPPAEVWMTHGISYKFVLEDSLNNIIATYDNVSGINDITSSNVFGEWIATNLTPSYLSATSFTFSGNQTTLLFPNGRLKMTNTGGVIYGTIQTVTYNAGSGLTTIVVSNDSGSLDAGLSIVSYSFLNPTNPSVPGEYLAFNAPVVIAVAGTLIIGAQASANITITGSGVAVTAFDNALAGLVRYVKFSGNNTLTNSGQLVLPIAPTMTVNAGDNLVFRSLGSGNWECIEYAPVLTNYDLSTTHALVATDKGQRLTCTGTMSLTGVAATLGAGWFCYVENDGVGVLTFSSTSSNIYQVGGSTTGQSSINIPDSGTGANPYNNSMVLITTDGANFNVCPVSVPHGSTTFLASGSWVAPRGVFSVWLTGSGGGGNGGAGGSANPSGGSGGTGGACGSLAFKTQVSVVPGTTYTVTIGGVGAATSFGALLTLAGGTNGTNGIANNGGSLGSSSGTTGAGIGGGQGGYGTSSPGAGIAGAAAKTNSGSGGGGGSGGFKNNYAGGAGGAGASGYLIVEW